jgi:hypothetical protein
MWLTAVLSSALVRSVTVLTDAVPGGCDGGGNDGGGGGDDGGGGGEGEGGGGEGGEGGGGGGEGGEGGGGGGEGGGGDAGGMGGDPGGGAGQVETVPETPLVMIVGQEQTVPQFCQLRTLSWRSWGLLLKCIWELTNETVPP